MQHQVLVLQLVQIWLLCMALIPALYWVWIRNNEIERSEIGSNRTRNQKITIILPTRNEELYISRKIETMVSEVVSSDEIKLIVVDSNSSDNTRSYAISALEGSFLDDSRWEVQNYTVTGKTKVLNKCLEGIESDIIILSDADAYVKPGWLEVLLERFSDQDIAVISGIEDIGDWGANFFTSFYRRSSNVMRIRESEIDSTPVLEGSLIAWKPEYLRGFRFNEKMNADDSQLSFGGIARGKRSIVDDRIKFSGFEERNRTIAELIRRSQGLSLSLLQNYKMIFRPTRPNFWLIYVNSIFIYVILPWIIFGLALSSIVGLSNPDEFGSLLSVIIAFLFLILALARRGRAILFASTIVILAHFHILIGKRYHRWEPVRLHSSNE